KIALIGNEAVGKTALVRVLLGLSFPTTHSATFEDEFRWPAAPTPLVIFDMAGAAAYDRLRPFSYPGIPAFLICFAVDERRSFRDVEDKWVPELQYYVPGVRIHLAALKTDLRDDPETAARMLGNAEEAVSEVEGREMAARIGAVGYCECSALRNEAVRELIEEVL
ncbi:Rho family GTPase, partial [Geranomyces variabilis]